MEKSDKEKQQQQGNPMSLPLRPRGSDEPWLVFFHGKREQNQTFYSISEDHNHLKNMPCLRRKVVCACSHGWMVLTARSFDRCYGCCLVNPTTLEKIQLPPVDFHFNKCVLSSSPTNSSCTVLFITSPQCDVITFRFSCPKKSSNVDRWIKQEVKFEDSGGITDATSCDGKIYGLTCRFNDILIIEAVDTKTLTVKKIGIESCLPSLKETLPINVVLVESCGELYAIRRIYAEQYKPQEIQDFEVFKLHFSRKSWERVKSLGNRAFFLGRKSRCSASAKESDSDLGIMGNTIYFTMNADRSLYAFNLEEKSVSVSLPCPNVQYNWSEPNWMLLSSSEE